MAPLKLLVAVSLLAGCSVATAQPAAPSPDYGLSLRSPRTATPNLTQGAGEKRREAMGVTFLYGPGSFDSGVVPDIDPGFNRAEGLPTKPQPEWKKREFNGREFYHIPLPAPGIAG